MITTVADVLKKRFVSLHELHSIAKKRPDIWAELTRFEKDESGKLKLDKDRNPISVHIVGLNYKDQSGSLY